MDPESMLIPGFASTSLTGSGLQNTRNDGSFSLLGQGIHTFHEGGRATSVFLFSCNHHILGAQPRAWHFAAQTPIK